LSAQEVKEDLPKPTDGRIMVELEEAIRQLRVVRSDASVAGSLRQITLCRPPARGFDLARHVDVVARRLGIAEGMAGKACYRFSAQ